MSDADEDDLAAWGRWNADRVAELEAELAAARTERDRLVAGLTALVGKLDAVHADPAYQWVWQCAQLHSGPYQGPRYDKELEAARATLGGFTIRERAAHD